MIEIQIEDKQMYLVDNYPFDGIPDLSEKRHCIHCNEIITVGDFKVYVGDNGFEFICCPNAPERSAKPHVFAKGTTSLAAKAIFIFVY